MTKHYLYIIGCKQNGPIKIGISGSHKKRLLSLQTSCHLELVLIKSWALTYSNAIKLEKVTHIELAKYRLKGEWFSCTPHTALNIIKKISTTTKSFKDWTPYYTANKTKVWLDNASAKGGKAMARRSKREFWEGFSKIKDRWHLKDTSKALMKEADIGHHDTVRVNLGYTRWEWRRLSDAKRERVLNRKARERSSYHDR